MRFTGSSLFLMITLLISCTNHKGSVTGLEGPDSLGEVLISKQKELLKGETMEIDAYISRTGKKMNVSQTGLRYMVESTGTPGDSLKPMDEVTIAYEVSLLNGEPIYSSDSTGKLNLVIGRSELATGLQEGLQYMKTGDKAFFILPSHLAYGLTGDGDRIKGYQPLVIHVGSVEKSHK